MEGGREALVTYRNRAQEVHVPAQEDMPDWTTEATSTEQSVVVEG
jgi:hypothetical protein